MMAGLGESTKVFKYLTVFSLSDPRKIILDGNIGLPRIIIAGLVCLTMAVVTYVRYNKKELV